MKKQEHKQIISIDQFDQEVSLHQLIPSGKGTGLAHLKTIVNSVLHNPEQQTRKPLSLLIIGKEGTRTHGRSFLRGLGLEDIRETPALLLNHPNAMHNYFNPMLLTQSFLVSNVDHLFPPCFKTLYEIIGTGEFTANNHEKRCREQIYVYDPIVLTCRDIDKIPGYFTERIDHVVKMGEYTQEQLELIVLQRLKYCGLDYENEEVLSSIVENGCGCLHIMIRHLKDAITGMMAEDRMVLTVGDLKKVMSY